MNIVGNNITYSVGQEVSYVDITVNWTTINGVKCQCIDYNVDFATLSTGLEVVSAWRQAVEETKVTGEKSYLLINAASLSGFSSESRKLVAEYLKENKAYYHTLYSVSNDKMMVIAANLVKLLFGINIKAVSKYEDIKGFGS